MARRLTESITSPDNAKFRLWRSLLSGKGLRSEGLCLVSGRKILQELGPLANRIDCELIPPGAEPLFPEVSSFHLSAELFKILDELGTHFNIVVLKTQPILPMIAPTSGLHLICPLGDPINLGACLRSAEAFAVSSVILTLESSSPYLPKALKASSGSSLRLPLYKGPSVHDLKLTAPLIALDLQGTAINSFVWPKTCYLLVGEEGLGVPATSQVKQTIHIPTQGVESLNASVATSIALYDFANKAANPSKA